MQWLLDENHSKASKSSRTYFIYSHTMFRLSLPLIPLCSIGFSEFLDAFEAEPEILSLFFSMRRDSLVKSIQTASQLYFLRDGSLKSSSFDLLLPLRLPLLVLLALLIILEPGTPSKLLSSTVPSTISLFLPQDEFLELIDRSLIGLRTRCTRFTHRQLVSGTTMVCMSTSFSLIFRYEFTYICRFFLQADMMYSALILFFGAIWSIPYTISFRADEQCLERFRFKGFLRMTAIYSGESTSNGTLRQHSSQMTTPSDQISHFDPQPSSLWSHTSGLIQKGEPVLVLAMLPCGSTLLTFKSPSLKPFSLSLKILAGLMSLWAIWCWCKYSTASPTLSNTFHTNCSETLFFFYLACSINCARSPPLAYSKKMQRWS